MNLNKNGNSPSINYTFVHTLKRFPAGETPQSSPSSSASDEIRTEGLDKSYDAPQSTSSKDPPSYNDINSTRSCSKEINSGDYLHNDNTNVVHIITPIERIRGSQIYNQNILSRKYTQTFICSNNKPRTEKSNSAITDKEISTDSSGAYASPICPEKFNEVIKKTIERNIKLQILVDNIILARERDNYKIAWQHCVNELKKNRNSPLEPEIDNFITKSPNSYTFYPIGSFEQNTFGCNDYAKLTTIKQSNNNQRHVPAYPEASQLTLNMFTKNKDQQMKEERLIGETHNTCTNLSQSENCNEIDYGTKHELYKDIFGNNMINEFNSDGSFLNNKPKENKIHNMFDNKMTENKTPLVYNEYNPCMNDKKKKKRCNCAEGGGFLKSVSCQCSNTTNNTTTMPAHVANINNSRQLDTIETKLDKLLTTVDDLIKNMQNSSATVGRQLDESSMKQPLYISQDRNIGTTETRIGSGCCRKKLCRSNINKGFDNNSTTSNPQHYQYYESYNRSYNNNGDNSYQKYLYDHNSNNPYQQYLYNDSTHENFERTSSPINIQQYKHTEGCCSKPSCMSNRGTSENKGETLISSSEKRMDTTHLYNQQDINTTDMTKSGCCNKQECHNNRSPGTSGQDEFTDPGNANTEATKMKTPECYSKKQLPNDRNRSHNVSNGAVSRQPQKYTEPSNTKEKSGCCTRKKCGSNENIHAKSNSVPEEDTITKSPKANNKSGCCNIENYGTNRDKNNASLVASKCNSTKSIDKDTKTKKSKKKEISSCCSNKDCNRNNNSVIDKHNNAKKFTNQQCCTHEDFGQLKCNCEQCSSKKCKAKPLFWQKSRDKACKLFCKVNKKRNTLVSTTGLGEKKDCDEVCLLELSSYEYNCNRRPKEVPLIIKDSSDSERCASPSAGRYGNDNYIWTLTKFTPGPFTYCSDNSEEEIKIHNLFNKQLSCESYESHVDICIDIPTRDISTVVTASLSKTQLCEKFSCENKFCAIPSTKAINTEPLTLPSIIRLSSDTIKRLLPTMKFEQFSLFELLHKIHPTNVSTPYIHRPHRFVCSLCGSGFGTSTELCGHINSHNLCWKKICKIGKVNNSQGLSIVKVFPCRYCGREFERAYCCGWHENLCARSRGQAHDVNESLTFLK